MRRGGRKRLKIGQESFYAGAFEYRVKVGITSRSGDASIRFHTPLRLEKDSNAETFHCRTLIRRPHPDNDSKGVAITAFRGKDSIHRSSHGIGGGPGKGE